MIIHSFLQTNSKLIDTLANNWLTSQADSFAVWCGETQLACWPSNGNTGDSDARAEIQVRGKGIGELRLAGLSGESVTKRLQLDASFLAGIIEREQHSSNLASELIDTRDQLVALFNLNQTPWTSLELDQTLYYLVIETIKLTRSQAAFIWLKASTEHLACTPDGWIDTSSAAEYMQALETRRKKHLFVESDSGSTGDEVQNLLILPIRLPGANTALIGIRTKVDGFSISPLIKLMNTIGEYAGTRIENLMMVNERMALVRLRTEMDLARNVQLSLLPANLPVVPGLEIWAATRPASLVGGDFYDFIEQPEGLLTISVGDISGKGLPASLPMAMVRSLIRAQTRIVPFLTPQKILYATNGEVIDDFTQMTMFATVFIAQYDAGSNSFLYTNAGHSPVIYCPADGEAHMLEADDIPLGMLPNILYANRRLPFQVGDVLLIGTDGLYEAHNRSDEMYGHENLIERVSALAHRSASDIANELFESVNDFREGESQEDDQTLIIIKRVA